MMAGLESSEGMSGLDIQDGTLPWLLAGVATGAPTHRPISAAAAAAKLLQSCPTLRNPMDCGPPGSSIHGLGILTRG